MNYPHAHIENRRLQGVFGALRELGKTSGPPAKVFLKLVKTQKIIADHLEAVQKTNNALIEQFGEENEKGEQHVTAEMDGWREFQKEAKALDLLAFNVGEPFVLYQRELDGETVIGWTDPVKIPLDLPANLVVDVGDLIVIDAILDEDEYADDEKADAGVALVE